jgi:hypothetical protein
MTAQGPPSLDPAAADLLRIHNLTVARVGSARRVAAAGPGEAGSAKDSAHPPPRQQEDGSRGRGRRRTGLGQRWRNTVGLARELVTALRVSMPS